MPVYNKLVRDKIPQVIESNGKSFRTRILKEVEYRQELDVKLREESEEYLQAKDKREALEEMADMLEVIRSLAALHGASWEQLEAIRADKAVARGGFKDRIYLIDVDDD